MNRIVVIDNGMGNIKSVVDALKRVAAQVSVACKSDELLEADSIVLPGVGSFPNFMANLRARYFMDALEKAVLREKNILGICVGMQVMAELGLEIQPTLGLGFIQGEVQHLSSLGVRKRIPHVGWNEVKLSEGVARSSPLRVIENRDVYFMHSYGIAASNESCVGVTSYDVRFASIVQAKNILGVQFHPEKSQFAGLDFLESWTKLRSDS